MSTFVWTDGAVREALGLRVELADASVAYARVCTDSRSIEEGDLYVALMGPRFDGHDFVVDALSNGARGAVVARQVDVESRVPLYPVVDTLVALGSLAAHRRAALGASVVAITGSSGKTTTKDLTAAALSGARSVHATEGNLNNRVGMPLTLLRTPDDAEVVVLELGTSEPGEIATLASIAKPDIGVVTTVGEAHLEKLVSVEGVLQEKLDLLRGLAQGGRCVVGDEPAVLAARARGLCSTLRVAGWSERADPELRPGDADVDVFGTFRFRWRGETVTMALPGKHAVANAMLALAVADLLGVRAKEAVPGLARVQPAVMRGETRRIGDVTVVIDCYNANPQSVRAAIDLLEAQAGASRTVAVLGTMLELGVQAPRLHEAVLADVLRSGVDLVVATGDFSHAAAALAAEEPRVLRADDWQAAYPALLERLAGDEVVLLKASRGVAMEGLLPLLERAFGSGLGAPAMPATAGNGGH